jgi:Type IV secretion system pilin
MRFSYKKSALLVVSLLIWLLPFVILAQTNTELQNPLGQGVGAWEIFTRVIWGLSFVAGTVALVFTVLGGYMILTAAGNSERYATGKKSIIYAITGMFIIVGSYQILTTTINILTGAATGSGNLPSLTTGSSLVDPLGITATVPSGQSIVILYGQRLVGYLVNLLGVAVVAMYVYGGLVWMLSGGSEEKISQAKKILGYATIGAAVVLCSYILIKFIYTPFFAILKNG